MKNYDLTVEELKAKKITGIKLPGSIDDFGFTVKDGNKIEVPIHGVQNGTVELELLGRADTIEFVAEEKKEEVATPSASKSGSTSTSNSVSTSSSASSSTSVSTSVSASASTNASTSASLSTSTSTSTSESTSDKSTNSEEHEQPIIETI